MAQEPLDALRRRMANALSQELDAMGSSLKTSINHPL